MRKADAEELRILYRDSELVVVYKPAGMFVHRSRLGTSAHYLVQTLRDQLGCRVHPCHRLDRPTAGLMLFALSESTASRMGELLRERRLEKGYQAVVRGKPPECGRLEGILRDPSGREREALTDFRLLGRGEVPVTVGAFPTAIYSLLELNPRTGRRHQLRRQLHSASHPILGDTIYGDGRHNRISRELLDCSRLLLWATTLHFPHPDGGDLFVSAAPDPELQRVCARLGWAELLSGDRLEGLSLA